MSQKQIHRKSVFDIKSTFDNGRNSQPLLLSRRKCLQERYENSKSYEKGEPGRGNAVDGFDFGLEKS